MFKYSKKTYYKFFLVIILILFIIVDIFLVRFDYNDYNEKIEILSATLSEEDRTEVVADILKGNKKIDTKTGDKFLNEYGYTKNSNKLYREYKKKVTTLIIMSSILYVIITSIIILIYKLEKKKLEKDINNLSEIVIKYKGENFEIEEVDLENKTLEYFKNDLVSLGSKLNILTKRVMLEKEETKALVTDISHQLKTPVAALKNSLEIPQEVTLTKEEEKEFYERSLIQVNGIENLLKALINISRMEIGIISIKKENTFILETIINAFNTVYEKAEDKNIKIKINTEEDIDKLKVFHDKKWLGEAFINILDNAIKYSPNHTEVQINIVKMVSFLRVEFVDSGIGVGKSEYNDIFKRFYRGDKELVSLNEGSGVGLYLTRKIVSEHFGTISVHKNKTKNGTTFVIQIPYN